MLDLGGFHVHFGILMHFVLFVICSQDLSLLSDVVTVNEPVAQAPPLHSQAGFPETRLPACGLKSLFGNIVLT